jgi:hypothetical protein
MALLCMLDVCESRCHCLSSLYDTQLTILTNLIYLHTYTHSYYYSDGWYAIYSRHTCSAAWTKGKGERVEEMREAET